MDIFNKRKFLDSIYTNAWLLIEYKDYHNELTKFYVDIIDIDSNGKIVAYSSKYLGSDNIIRITMNFNNIVSCKLEENFYHIIHDELIRKIEDNQNNFNFLFYENVSNISYNLLNYYQNCFVNDTVNDYEAERAKCFEELRINENSKRIPLNDDLIIYIKEKCSCKNRKNNGFCYLYETGLNVLSIRNFKTERFTPLLYKKVRFNLINKEIVIEDEIFTLSKSKNNDDSYNGIYSLIPEDSFNLLDDNKNGLSGLKEQIRENLKSCEELTDEPFFFNLKREVVNISKQYDDIKESFNNLDTMSDALKVFLGITLPKTDLNSGSMPIVVYDKNKIDLYQMDAVYNAMSDADVTFVKGPPGTGKTKTILSIILSYFFNGKKVLISTFNNKPVNDLLDGFNSILFRDAKIPFPIIKIGNKVSTIETLKKIKSLIEECKYKKFDDSITKKNNINRKEELLKLQEFFYSFNCQKRYLRQIKLIDGIMKCDLNTDDLNIYKNIKDEISSKLIDSGIFTDENAKSLLANQDDEKTKAYYYYYSLSLLNGIKDSEPLKEILKFNLDDDYEADNAYKKFIFWIKDENGINQLLKIFPIVVTTNLGSSKIGPSKCFFDLCIIDEAAQCNISTSILPISRCKKLLLVGDEEQLKPIILINQRLDEYYKNKFGIPLYYDYVSESIYSCFTKLDAINDTILLKNNYRCGEKIIDFCNKTFYGGELVAKNNSSCELFLYDVPFLKEKENHESISEVEEIIKYVKSHLDEDIGIITPFKKQKQLLQRKIFEVEKISKDRCKIGTIHEFQGSENSTILFSTGFSKNTTFWTYKWVATNKQLINVAVSRAKLKFLLYTNINLVNSFVVDNDFFIKLIKYIKNNGELQTIPLNKDFIDTKELETPAEQEFARILAKIIKEINDDKLEHFTISKKKRLADIINIDSSSRYFLYASMCHIDLSIEKDNKTVMAFEVNGLEHTYNKKIADKDKIKAELCSQHNLQLISVPNNATGLYFRYKKLICTRLG